MSLGSSRGGDRSSNSSIRIQCSGVGFEASLHKVSICYKIGATSGSVCRSHDVTSVAMHRYHGNRPTTKFSSPYKGVWTPSEVQALKRRWCLGV